MIKHKRYLYKRVPLKNPKINKYFEDKENDSILESFQFKKELPLHKRISLTQMVVNMDQKISQNPSFIKKCEEYQFEANQMNQSQFNNGSKLTSTSLKNDNLLSKLSSSSKKPSICLGQRPKSCSSQFSRNRYDQVVVKQCNLMLDLSSKEGSGERMSTSRALAKFSRVQRNISSNRFMVRKDKSLIPEYFSARKIIFQTKGKKEKVQMVQTINIKQSEHTYNIPLSEYTSHLRSKKLRFLQGEEFQLKGWDYD